MTIIKSNATSLYVQEYPGAAVIYLGDYDESCFSLDTIPNPKGSVDPIHCLNGAGEIIVSGTTRSGRDLVSYTVENLLKQAVNQLELYAQQDCPFVFHAVQRCGGVAGVIGARVRSSSLWGNRFTDDALGTVAQRDATEPMMRTFEITAQSPRVDTWEIVASQKTTSETEDANTIHSYVIIACDDECGSPANRCDVIVVGCDASGAATANVLRSADGGNTWAATAADPFAGTSENITSIRMFQVGSSTVRIIAARNTDAANPGEVSYSDDNGATWTEVAYGSTNGEFVETDQGIFPGNENNLWLCTDQGNVFFSANAGAAWTVQSSALTASGGNDLMAMHMATLQTGIAVGDSDTIIYTDDGGTNWTAATATGGGNNLITCHCFSRYRWIVGDDGGEIYQTWDGGATWTQMTTWTGSGTGSVTNIKFENPLRGFMSHIDGSTVGRILETIDGGFSWERIGGATGVASAGLNAIHPCGLNHVFGVGDDDAATAIIIEAGQS